MNDPVTLTPTPDSPAATAGISALPTTEPAFLSRARRILADDIRPEDYLPLTPEARAAVNRDLAFAREHIQKAASTGRIPTVYEPDPSVPIQQRNNWLLSFHFGGQNIAHIENDAGVIVLAVGLDQTRALLDAFPYELRKDVFLDTPLPLDTI
jgi:hypothetical protein